MSYAYTVQSGASYGYQGSSSTGTFIIPVQLTSWAPQTSMFVSSFSMGTSHTFSFCPMPGSTAYVSAMVLLDPSCSGNAPDTTSITFTPSGWSGQAPTGWIVPSQSNGPPSSYVGTGAPWSESISTVCSVDSLNISSTGWVLIGVSVIGILGIISIVAFAITTYFFYTSTVAVAVAVADPVINILPPPDVNPDPDGIPTPALTVVDDYIPGAPTIDLVQPLIEASSRTIPIPIPMFSGKDIQMVNSFSLSLHYPNQPWSDVVSPILLKPSTGPPPVLDDFLITLYDDALLLEQY